MEVMEAIKTITLNNVILQKNGILRDEKGRLIAKLVDRVKFDDYEKSLIEANMQGAMDINTVKEIIKLCTVLHDSPDAGIEEASGIDLVRMQLEDVLITLKEKKKWETKHY